MTNEALRKMLKNAGIKPAELTEREARLLVDHMSLMCSQTNVAGDTFIQRQWHVNQQTTRTYMHADGSFHAVRVNVNGPYFENRQLAFVRDDGCVELAGWADARNSAPIERAFEAWVDDLVRLREQAASSDYVPEGDEGQGPCVPTRIDGPLTKEAALRLVEKAPDKMTLDVIVPIELDDIIEADGIEGFDELVDRKLARDYAFFGTDFSFEARPVDVRVTCTPSFLDDPDGKDEDE